MQSTEDMIKALQDKQILTGKDKGRIPVPALDMLDYRYGTDLPCAGNSFEEIIENLDASVCDLYEKYNNLKPEGKPEAPKPSSQALSNCHGTWTEYICDVFAWNELCKLNKYKTDDEECYVYVKLHSRKGKSQSNSENDNGDSLDALGASWRHLLSEKVNDRIDRKLKITMGIDADDTQTTIPSDIKLESSNPDAVILRLKSVDLPKDLDPRKPFSDISKRTQGCIYQVFTQCRGKVERWEQVVAFISVKNSTRPDRRYQWIVEGNSVKALIAAAFGGGANSRSLASLMNNKFYAFRLNKKIDADDPDRAALIGLIMFASLFNEAVGLAFAIDDLFGTTTPQDFAEQIAEICQCFERDPIK